MSEAAFKHTDLTRKALLDFSVSLKLPETIILRVNDLLVFAALDH